VLECHLPIWDFGRKEKIQEMVQQVLSDFAATWEKAGKKTGDK
jgi:hypothetical protein